MFEISWGEIFIVGSVGIAVTGKRDLPKACRFVGTQIGRVVGLLQGARSRADKFAQQNELKALQNELRLGLRELDKVKAELAIAASSQGVIGRGLGATTTSANKGVAPNRAAAATNNIDATKSPTLSSLQQEAAHSSYPPSGENPTGDDGKGAPLLDMQDFNFHIEEKGQTMKASATAASLSDHSHPQPYPMQQLPPVIQTERAVIEEEWKKQGIDFRARAEGSSWNDGGSGDENDGKNGICRDTTRATGSELLEHLIRQCLIFDQYDRVVGEQEAEMEERVERIRRERADRDK